jgi:hypothetical protein
MKTMTRLLFAFVAIMLCANAYAQNSVNDLFNTYVVLPAQQRIQILTDELNLVNAQVQDLQQVLANAPATPVLSAEEGGNPDAVNPPSPLVAQIAELQTRATELQGGLTYWQAQLTLLLSFDVQQQEQYLLSHSDEILATTGQNVSALLTGQDDRMGTMPDPNNPWLVPVFVSTGDSQKDSDLITQWLIQHGVMKNE